jgi:hypothetical protein
VKKYIVLSYQPASEAQRAKDVADGYAPRGPRQRRVGMFDRRLAADQAAWDTLATDPKLGEDAFVQVLCDGVGQVYYLDRDMVAEGVTRPGGDLIGPLTAAEWVELRHRHDDDLLRCCGVTSAFRTEVFNLLCMGPETVEHNGRVLPGMMSGFRGAYWDMVEHGFPEGRGGELIARLARYFLGDAPALAEDRMSDDGVTVDLCKYSGQPTLNISTDRYAVSALPPEHRDYRYLVIHVDRVSGTDRWRLRWSGFVFNADAADPACPWEPETSSPDGVDPDEWWAYRQFTLAGAMRFAQDQATRVTVGGRTAADIASTPRRRDV